MFNNINDNNLYNSQLGNASNVINLAAIREKKKKTGYNSNPYVDKTEISANAMELFQRDLDINKFNKILYPAVKTEFVFPVIPLIFQGNGNPLI